MADDFSRPPTRQPRDSRGRLSDKRVDELFHIATELELYDRREVLLLAIPPHFKSTMPKASAGESAGDLLKRDLHYLNEAGVLQDGSDPLKIWLRNAHDALGNVEEAEIFLLIQAELDESPGQQQAHGRFLEPHETIRQSPDGLGYLLARPARHLLNWPALPSRRPVGGSIPCNLAVRWGLDRGGFIGVVGGAPGLRLIDALMTAELELRAALRQGVPPLVLPIRMWLNVPSGSTPTSTFQELLCDAVSSEGERVPLLLTAFQEHEAIPGFVLTWQTDSVSADEVINTLAGAFQMLGSGAPPAAAFCLELTGEPHHAATLIEHATTRLLERGVSVDSFSQTPASAHPAKDSPLGRLLVDLGRRQFPEEPSLLRRLRSILRESESSLSSAESSVGDELAKAPADDIERAVGFVRDRLPGLAFDLIFVLASSPAESTRLAALAAVADSDWLLDAWVAGVGRDVGKMPEPSRLIPTATPVSLRTNLVCAMMRRRRDLDEARKSFDETIDRLLASANRELVAVVDAIRSGAVQRPAFFDINRGPERLYLLRRCAPDVVVPIDELTPASRNQLAIWRLVQSLDLRREFLTRALRLAPSARAVLGLCTMDEKELLRSRGRWDEIHNLRRF